MTNKGRPDLIEDINSALNRILTNDLHYFHRIQEQYFSETTRSSSLTVEEKNWIAGHKVLRVGYFDNYLPFSAKDKNGEPIGAGIEAIREIIRKLKLEDQLEVEFICFKDQVEGYKAVESGKVDLMLPAYISGSVRHDYHIIGGKILATLTSDVAYRTAFGDGKGKRIAVNKHNLMQYYYSKDCFPYSKIVFYNDIHGCLDSLLDGTSDGTVLNSFRTEALLRPVKYRSLRAERAGDFFKFRMAFAENNIGLMLLMDRGLTMLDHDFISGTSYSFARRMNFMTVMDYLRDHLLLVLLAVAILVAVSISLIWYRTSLRKLEAFNRELKERSETIEKQRQQESNLRQELEKKQTELEAALQKAQAAYADNADMSSSFYCNPRHEACGCASLPKIRLMFLLHIRS